MTGLLKRKKAFAPSANAPVAFSALWDILIEIDEAGWSAGMTPLKGMAHEEKIFLSRMRDPRADETVYNDQ